VYTASPVTGDHLRVGIPPRYQIKIVNFYSGLSGAAAAKTTDSECQSTDTTVGILKKCFNSRWKVNSELAELTLLGSRFQTCGAANMKAQLPTNEFDWWFHKAVGASRTQPSSTTLLTDTDERTEVL